MAKIIAVSNQKGGVGKTTTTFSLGVALANMGKKVLLVAADTFRAGATAQLKEWSEKIGVGFYGREEGADPASVVFDGLVKAKEEKYDVVLIDTAGRLQNKVNLMKELEKMNKVIEGQLEGGASETLLVIDATTGQNGISQAKAFKEKYGEDPDIKYHPEIRNEEACYQSTKLAVQLAKETGARLHILHISTAKELSLLENKPLSDKNITAEEYRREL